MARHLIGEREAFELLRSHSRRTGRKVVDGAAAVVDRPRSATDQPPAHASGDSRRHKEAPVSAAEQ
jgi:hypothetical protein